MATGGLRGEVGSEELEPKDLFGFLATSGCGGVDKQGEKKGERRRGEEEKEER